MLDLPNAASNRRRRFMTSEAQLRGPFAKASDDQELLRVLLDGP